MKKTGHLSSVSCGKCYNGNPSSAAPPGTWQRTSGFFDILHESKFTCENLHARCHKCKSQCLLSFRERCRKCVGSFNNSSLVCSLVCVLSLRCILLLQCTILYILDS